MKYVKLYEGFLSEKKKKEDEEDPGTELSNTTGIIATAEVTEKEGPADIDKWDDKRVEMVFNAMLDEMSATERKEIEDKKMDIKQKREYLKSEDKKFAAQFKK
jgi:hypothetical protein